MITSGLMFFKYEYKWFNVASDVAWNVDGNLAHDILLLVIYYFFLTKLPGLKSLVLDMK